MYECSKPAATLVARGTGIVIRARAVTSRAGNTAILFPTKSSASGGGVNASRLSPRFFLISVTSPTGSTSNVICGSTLASSLRPSTTSLRHGRSRPMPATVSPLAIASWQPVAFRPPGYRIFRGLIDLRGIHTALANGHTKKSISPDSASGSSALGRPAFRRSRRSRVKPSNFWSSRGRRASACRPRMDGGRPNMRKCGSLGIANCARRRVAPARVCSTNMPPEPPAK